MDPTLNNGCDPSSTLSERNHVKETTDDLPCFRLNKRMNARPVVKMFGEQDYATFKQ